jgi:hypothetical protein
MYNIKSAVYTALTTTAVSTYTSVINYFFPKNFNSIPCVSYKRITSVPSLQFDDAENGSSIYYQIDIWTTNSPTNIEQAIDSAMKTAGFDRVGIVFEDYDKKQQIYQTSLRYKFDYAN